MKYFLVILQDLVKLVLLLPNFLRVSASNGAE